MPSHYMFKCSNAHCWWEGIRYRNFKICPLCKLPVFRVVIPVCKHGVGCRWREDEKCTHPDRNYICTYESNPNTYAERLKYAWEGYDLKIHTQALEGEE